MLSTRRYVQRHEYLARVGIALHQPELLQGVEFSVEPREVLYGFLHRFPLAGEVFLLVASIGLFT